MGSIGGPADGDIAAASCLPLRSFWIAGFDGADHRDAAGHDHDPQRATRHLERACDDYRCLTSLGICTVRESLGWRLTERPSGVDFSRLRHLQAAAQANGIQIIWSLMHYGMPDNVDCFDEHFVERFCIFVDAAGREFRRISSDVPVWTPINGINFLSWALTETDYVWPHRGGRAAEGYLLKRRLVRATLRAMDVLRALDPRARFMHVEPVIHIVAPPERPELADTAAIEESWQWQVWDMLSGRIEPDLGGGPDDLDLLGVLHDHNSQWEAATARRLRWHRRDPRWRPLGQTLAAAYRRYDRPVLVAETGHTLVDRGGWLDEMAGESYRVRRRGVPVIGYCIHCAVNRPDQEIDGQWQRGGLADTVHCADGRRARLLDRRSVRALRYWQRWLPARKEPRKSMHTLIVFSHLRWNDVYKRPQHVLTRLARSFRVLFVEEPLRGNATPYLERYSPARNVEVLRPRTTVDATGFDDAQFAEISDLLLEYLDDFEIDDYLVWFYTPQALPMLDSLCPRAVIYDCIDEFPALRDVPARMHTREAELRHRADVVFTGGPSLSKAGRHHHANVVCLPSAVDAAHFAPSAERAPDTDVQASLGEIPSPRFGFFGVIDERFDTELLDAVARARPHWQFVMIGPVGAGIDCSQLPKHNNIHWLGPQPYEKLPQHVAGWDVCLLPFTRNAPTRFISPTTALEYMAAERPIVSTPVSDIVSLYADAVEIAASEQDFIAACERLLRESGAERARRQVRMRAHVARTTWDAVAQGMLKQINGVLARRTTASSATTSADRARGTAPSRERVGGASSNREQIAATAGPAGRRR